MFALLVPAVVNCEGSELPTAPGDGPPEVPMWRPLEVPAEVAMILENYLNDSTAAYDLAFVRRYGRPGSFDTTTRIEDLEMGKPIPRYGFMHTFLDRHPDTVPLYEIIRPSDQWYVPVLANGRAIYALGLQKLHGQWEIYLKSTLPAGDNMWELLSEFYPESSGISPVLFVYIRQMYLYFPQLGPRMIYYLRIPIEGDPLAMVLPGTIEELDDSSKLMRYWKEQGINEVGVVFTDEEICELTGMRCGGEE
jgi:hypothetical protein